jgi:hypothetical protein
MGILYYKRQIKKGEGEIAGHKGKFDTDLKVNLCRFPQLLSKNKTRVGACPKLLADSY